MGQCETISQINEMAIDLSKRPRRNRSSHAIREMVQETRLHPGHFVMPIFIREGNNVREPIPSMPGVFRLTIDEMLREAEELLSLGIRVINLYCVVPKEIKDPFGVESKREGNLLMRGIMALKKTYPEICIMVDIALDPYTDHGHDGILASDGSVHNDDTLIALGEMCLLAARAGAEMMAPSDMMDGRVRYIRALLDREGFSHVGIMSYAAKYASAFYGPFRDALSSAPKFGDKKGYQMNPANSREALLECALDEAEGADMLLIKPALPYLDILAKVRAKTNLPIGAFHVSGEYAMVKAAAERGWINGEKAMYESVLSIKRAGADFIFTYACKEIAKML